MTDPLSTIRRDAEALYQIKKYGTANTPPHALRESILAACDALEADRRRLGKEVDVAHRVEESLKAMLASSVRRAEKAEAERREAAAERARDVACGICAEARERMHEAEDRVAALEAERLTLKTAIDEAEYALHPNQGEPADPVRASEILRSTWPKDHPNYTPHPVEAERLTPEEARGILDVLPQELWWWGGPSESQLAWLAKLEKWAGE